MADSVVVGVLYPAEWYGDDEGWIFLSGVILVGWGAAKWMYGKSGQAAPASYT